jgi:hypothetical protein
MSLAIRKIKVYSKLTLIVLVACAGALVLWKNRDKEVGVWFFWLTDPQRTVNVVWLMLLSGVGTLVAYWVLRTVFGVWREMKSVARDAVLADMVKEHAERSKPAEAGETVLDETTKKAISEKS